MLTADFAGRLALTALLLCLAGYDLWRGKVPNVVVLPLLLGATLSAIWRWWSGGLALSQLGLLAAAWAVGLGLWALRVFGGGDVKLALALVALFPTLDFALLLSAVLLAGLFGLLIWQQGLAGLRRLAALVFTSAAGALPTPAEIHLAYATRAARVTWLISLAGVWGVWGRLLETPTF